jgi:hypothetical protein
MALQDARVSTEMSSDMSSFDFNAIEPKNVCADGR